MKRILILTAGFGEGHNTAARNLMAGLRHVAGEEVSVTICDVCQRSTESVNQFFRLGYLTLIHHFPRFWKLLFALVHHTRFIQDNLWMFAHQIKTLRTTLDEVKPDIVCSTYPLYGHLLTRISQPSFKHIALVTDSITINSIWHTYPCDAWITPNEATREVMIGRGIPAAQIHSLGFPVQLDFIPAHNPVPRPSATCPPSVLYIINSRHYQAVDTLQRLVSIDGLRITVAAGKDEKLLQRLQKIIQPHTHRVTLLGWTDQIPHLLMTHHLVISKAGGATVQEAIAAECPMIVNQIVPGQEEGNFHLIESHRIGTYADNPLSIEKCVREAFAHDATLWKKWKAGFDVVSKPDSALRIADFLIQSV